MVVCSFSFLTLLYSLLSCLWHIVCRTCCYNICMWVFVPPLVGVASAWSAQEGSQDMSKMWNSNYRFMGGPMGFTLCKFQGRKGAYKHYLFISMAPMWRKQKGQFVWDASVGGTTFLRPQGASSPPRTIRIVHPCNLADSLMHASMELTATTELGEPFGHTKPSLLELYMLEVATITKKNIHTMLQV